MKQYFKLAGALILMLWSSTMTAQTEKTLAFPGAEGFGRYVTGGRGGAVYHVTNLKDSGEGSLRWANAQQGPRTIVFDVSGTIFLKSALKIANNTTLAGQTAPGDGICVADYPVTLGSNVICRYLRFRLGNQQVANHEGDGLGSMDDNNIIVDHCSVSWSIDECLSVYGGRNLTVQWSITAQSLVNSGHSKGAHGYGGNWGGSGASFHHNLIAHHTSRTPRLGPRQGTQTDERMDMRNNVIYNWGGNGCYGGEGMNVNIVNNYYKPGPATKERSTTIQQRIAAIGIRTTSYCQNDDGSWNGWYPMWHVWGKYYVEGNINTLHSNVTNDNWTYGMYNQIDASGNDGTYTQTTKDTMRINAPIPFVAVTTHTADAAYEKVLAYAGASLHRDALDEIIINDTRNGKATCTGSGLAAGFINSQEDVASQIPTLWPELKSETAATDSDGDGMPDSWETAHGTDPNNASDGNTVGSDGYTNLEVYLNSLVADITAKQNEGGEQQGYIEEIINPGGEEKGKTTIATGSITWPLNTGAAGQTASYDEAVSKMITGNSMTLGSNISYGGTQKINSGEKLTKFTSSVKNEATANDNNAVTFEIAVADGYYFRPTNIAFQACKCGTDGGKLDVNWINEYGKTEIELGLSPERNNNYTDYKHEVNTIASAAGSSKLVFHIYSLGTDKALAVGNIVINGEMKQETTGISNIRYTTIGNSRFYNLQGMCIANPTKGIYIQNGKKIIIK